MVNMKKVIKGIWSFLEVIILIYVVIMTLFFLNKNRFGFTEIGNRVFVSVDKDIAKEVSGSKNLDLIIIRKGKEIDNKKDTFYYSSLKDRYVVKKGKVTVDNNNAYYANDSLISSERVIGNKYLKIPLIGGFLRAIEDKLGFIAFVFLPIFLVFIYQVYDFVISSKKEHRKAIEIVANEEIVDDEII